MFRTQDIGAINSVTKYPSIPTFHTMGGRGKLGRVNLAIPDEQLYCTEKLDGTNARIIIDPRDGDYLIGGRNELLYARGDRLIRDSNRILLATIVKAEQAAEKLKGANVSTGPVVAYGEVYGGRIGANWKTYADDEKAVGFRVFDTQVWTAGMWFEWLHMDSKLRSTRREQGGQPFVGVDELERNATWLGFKTVPVSPFDLEPKDSQTGIFAQLCEMGLTTQAALTETINANTKRPEGVVLRTANRSWIAKFRIEDYERSIR